ncbi:DUF7345 domain-containing protein [Salinibaculum rarum]|uniref:DUF7345 domain-containing protein n=1 Tax=Salinibaculum rarum TaxID=3058903 RepID=UPI00266022E0|nr:hypothetical protein [Salinibaculum sp. KK48]
MRDRFRQSGIALGFVALLLVSATGGAAATAPTGTQQTHDGAAEPPAFVVDLQSDGAATVTVSYTYDLSDADRKAAFEELQNSTDARSDFRDRFESRLRSVAATTENATGREMSVADATLEFRTDGDTGIVTAAVEWDGLTAVDGDQLTLTEPFASGFTTERAFHVIVPDEYTVSSVTPSPDQQTAGHLTWTDGTDLNGFELVTTAPAETATGDETEPGSDATTDDSAGDSGPGFGVVAVVAAIAGLLAVGRRH